MVPTLLLAACAGGMVALHGDPPQGRPGPEAEALAHALQASVAIDAWDETGAVRWAHGGGNQHLWDRRRNLERYRSGKAEVLIDLDSRRGRAWKGGVEVVGKERDALLDDAWDA